MKKSLIILSISTLLSFNALASDQSPESLENSVSEETILVQTEDGSWFNKVKAKSGEIYGSAKGAVKDFSESETYKNTKEATVNTYDSVSESVSKGYHAVKETVIEGYESIKKDDNSGVIDDVIEETKD